jgi:hypothetical protein
MNAIRPRQFVYRGSVLASGFMIRAQTIGLGEARSRVLELWQAGVRLKKVDGLHIILLPAPVRINAQQAVGEPLLRYGTLLAAVPLDCEAIKAIDASGDSLVFASGGQIQTLALMEIPDEDPAGWIDTSSIAVADVVTLGPPPAIPAFAPASFDPRRNIPGIPPAAPELQGLLAELRREQGALDRSVGRKAALAFVREGMGRLWRFVRRLRLPVIRRTQAPTGTQQRMATSAPKGSRGLARFWSALTRGLDRLLNFSRLSQLISSRHARYLASMMEMFQSGNIEEGLRHAIPLADSTKLASTRRSWFKLPQRRPDLSIRFQRPEPRSAWGMGGQWYNYLRDLYRQAFQRLEAQGRIEEAAFVLTELLAAHAEAVSFLEKHGRFRLAAEIAEDRKLTPVLAIRLWWLAKESRRAISLACRTGQFAQAIQLLVGHPAEADQLRLVWAERLQQSGKYLAAAEAVWPMKSESDLALKYLNQAIAGGGTAAAIALARKVARFPASFPEILGAVEPLMAEESYESAGARRVFAESLRNEPMNPESQVLARLTARALVRDVQQGLAEKSPVRLRRLLDFTGDPCLRTDVPPVELLAPGAKSLPAGVCELSASDVGSQAVYDLALLPDGRLLVALGEAGLILLSREGRQVAQWNQPAQRLVVSEDGTRALGLAQRDGICRLLRFDVLARKAEYWCDARLSAYCDDFDGSVWSIAEGEDLFLIDTLAPRFEPLWRVPALDGKVVAMQRNRKENRLHVVTRNSKLMTLWTFDHPSCQLRTKREFEADLNQSPALLQTSKVLRAHFFAGPVVVSADGDVCEQLTALLPAGNSQALICQIQTNPAGERKMITELTGGSLPRAATQGRRMAIPVTCADAIEIVLFDTHTAVAEVLMRLHGSKGVALRLAENVLLCGDDQGRIAAVDIASRNRVRDMRI